MRAPRRRRQDAESGLSRCRGIIQSLRRLRVAAGGCLGFSFSKIGGRGHGRSPILRSEGNERPTARCDLAPSPAHLPVSTFHISLMPVTRSPGLGDDNDAVTATCRRLARRSDAKDQTAADSRHCLVLLPVVLWVFSPTLRPLSGCLLFSRDRLFRTILSSRTRPLRAWVSTVRGA